VERRLALRLQHPLRENGELRPPRLFLYYEIASIKGVIYFVVPKGLQDDTDEKRAGYGRIQMPHPVKA